MDVETAKYFGYALQLLLVLVLVVSLACKSWALLLICLVAATALLTMVCYRLVSNQVGFKNVKLLKTGTMGDLKPSGIEPMTPMTPTTYQPPIYQGMTRDEQAALHLMSMTDRGVDMHAPVRGDMNQYIVPTSQGLDLHPYTNPYMVAASAQAPLPIHLDEMHPDNPMNSLSYLQHS